MDIAEFLTARLDEDEADARAAILPGVDADGVELDLTRWAVGNKPHDIRISEPSATHYGAFIAGVVDWRHGPHVARHDPARVLADVAAQRAIVAEHSTRVFDLASTPGLQYWCSTCHVPGDYAGRRYCLTLRALAQPFADHPDFDPSWMLTVDA